MNDRNGEGMPKQIFTPSTRFRLFQRFWQLVGLFILLFVAILVLLATLSMASNAGGAIVSLLWLLFGALCLAYVLYSLRQDLLMICEIGFDDHHIYFRHLRGWRSLAVDDIQAVVPYRFLFVESGSALVSDKLPARYWSPANGRLKTGRSLAVPHNIIPHEQSAQNDPRSPKQDHDRQHPGEQQCWLNDTPITLPTHWRHTVRGVPTRPSRIEPPGRVYCPPYEPAIWNEAKRCSATTGRHCPRPSSCSTHALAIAPTTKNLHFERRSALASLTLAECTEGEGRFLDDIVNGIWAICEESYWGVPAHIWFQSADNTLPDTSEPTVDLFAAETGSLLSWVSYLLGERLDTVSTLVRPRIHREVQRRVIEVCLTREDFVWMGFIDRGRPVNNWNPWVSSNWLTAVLLEEPDPQRRLASISKILRALDYFIEPYPRDGGCDEGPSYWGRAGASLFDCLEILRSATDGAIDLYDEPLIRKIGQFIYRVQIDENYYINFADASAMVEPDAMLVYRYGQRIGDPDMMALGRWLIEDQKLDRTGVIYGTGRVVAPSLGRVLPAIFNMTDALEIESRKPLPRDVWLDGIQVFAARDIDGSPEGLYVAAKGGHNEESHNHNDIGSFIVYKEGLPLLVDAGVESYTSKTFSDRRYEIWTMQSGYHSLLPTIDGPCRRPDASSRPRT